MTIPSPIITQTSSLVSTMISTSGSIDPRDEFDEEIVVSLGEYYYSKPDKSMIRKGKKRGRDQTGMEVSVFEQIIWTQQSGDPQVDAADTAAALGAFIGANIHAISNLNREFDRRKEEITQLKEELEKSKREHEAHVADLMKTSEDKYNELQVKSAFLQVELQNEKTSSVVFTQRIASLEKQCEDAIASAASSLFSRFSQEEFKQLAIKINEEHY